MTIEYKDSKRIVNLSTDVVNTPDINETFETDTKTAQNGTLVAWDSTDKRIEGTMSRINTNTNWIYDLGSDLSTTKFIVDFQFDIISNTNPTGTSATNFFQITSGTGGNQGAGGFSFTFESNGSGGYFGINAKNSGDMESGNTWGSAGTFASNTTYYMRMIRDGDDFTCIRYSDTWGGTVAETLEKTVSGVTGLRYWRIQNYNGATSSYNGVTTFAVDNLKLYNGVTSLTNKPTDVQDNSILVEKDTARRYWFTPQTVDTEEAFSFTTTDTVNSLWGNRIYGMKLLSGHSGLNKYIKKIKTYHPTNPTGSRLTTGTLYHVILDSSGTEIARSAGVSASSVSNNSWAETTLSTPVKLEENYTVGVTISTGSGSSYLGTAVNNNGSSPTNTTRYYKDESGNVGLSTSETMLMVFDSDPATGLSIPATWTRGYFPITRGVIAGGEQSPVSNIMDYITIATLGDATDFGDLTQARYGIASMYSDTRGVFACGYNGGYYNTIDYITILTAGNATDFGDASTATYSQAGVSNKTRGVFASNGASRGSNLDYITIATTGNATSGFGNLTRSTTSIGGNVNSETRGVFLAGNTSGDVYSNVMDYITIDTTGNAIDFGDLTVGRYSPAGLSSETRGVIFGGNISGNSTNNIDYITIDTTANATDFGDLLGVMSGMTGGLTNDTRGVMAGGGNASGRTNVIQYITIDTAGNSTDFGDLTLARSGAGGVSG